MPRRRVEIPALPEFVVEDPAALVECLTHLAASPEIAFDTEFVGELSYRPELCLVQVATRERLYLIDPYAAGPLDDFWNLLPDPTKPAVVHAGREEVRMCRAGVGKLPGNVFDLQIAAGLVGWSYPIGYAALVSDVLGVHMKKGETLTDWRRRPLTAAQVRYAFDDVRYLLPVFDRLTARLEKLKRPAWAAEEFATFLRKATTDEPAVERWRKLKGLGGLSRRELAVARELAAWREGVAIRVNRPARTVARDDLVLELVKRMPATADAVAQFRGLPKVEYAAIADAVRRGQAVPMADCPDLGDRDNDPAHVGLLTSLLGVVLNEWCARNHVAVGLTATTSDLRTLVRAKQPDGELPPNLPLLAGWRAAAVWPELDAFLSGERALRVTDATTRHPIGIEPVPRPPV